MVARKRREYSDKQREAVLADVIRLGVWEAASKHGHPVRYQVQVNGREVVLLAVPL